MAMSDRLLKAWYEGHPALTLLRPLESLYRGVVQRKRARFLAGEGEIYQSPVPVVVVGNITVGGTGKTPLILWLIEHCRRSGLRVGVVSRGYGAKPPQLPWRVEASETVDLILSDDGLQHYRLARDLELVLIDAARGLGNRRCLPAGPLREPVERLQSVDALLYNGAVSDRDDGFAFRLQPTALVNLLTGERQPVDHFPAGQPVHAVAGIGNPQRFFNTLETLHWQPIPHAFADHAPYSAEVLNFTPSLPLVMTEKDAVKCRAFAQPDWWYLAVDALPSRAFIAWFDTQLMRLLPARLLP